MSVADVKAITAIEKKEALARFEAAIGHLRELANGDAHIEQLISQAESSTRALAQAIADRDRVLAEASQYINAVEAANHELLNQRDAAVQELYQLIHDLTHGDFFSEALKAPGKPGIKGQIYQAAVEEHNAAFWESLPYDIADAMGEEWRQSDADMLYALITDDAIEAASGLDLDESEVIAFRAKLLKMIRELER